MCGTDGFPFPNKIEKRIAMCRSCSTNSREHPISMEWHHIEDKEEQ